MEAGRQRSFSQDSRDPTRRGGHAPPARAAGRTFELKGACNDWGDSSVPSSLPGVTSGRATGSLDDAANHRRPRLLRRSDGNLDPPSRSADAPSVSAVSPPSLLPLLCRRARRSGQDTNEVRHRCGTVWRNPHILPQSAARLMELRHRQTREGDETRRGGRRAKSWFERGA